MSFKGLTGREGEVETRLSIACTSPMLVTGVIPMTRLLNEAFAYSGSGFQPTTDNLLPYDEFIMMESAC